MAQLHFTIFIFFSFIFAISSSSFAPPHVPHWSEPQVYFSIRWSQRTRQVSSLVLVLITETQHQTTSTSGFRHRSRQRKVSRDCR
ncbi:BnaA08g07740D [Brassica napus]|uniref:BnaA08g07740D protein n=1 Tax=Brassica napus TaxID=3708 RepID=A0A078GP95_BRANA|nr:BnaA08g07740D [Brassica napus]